MSKCKKYSRVKIISLINGMIMATDDDAIEVILRDTHRKIVRLPKRHGILTTSELVLALEGNKIAAIRAYRIRMKSSGYDCGLLEAKEMVEMGMGMERQRAGFPAIAPTPPTPNKKGQKRKSGQRPKGKKSMKRRKATKDKIGEKN